jgi:hypothetical protein
MRDISLGPENTIQVTDLGDGRWQAEQYVRDSEGRHLLYKGEPKTRTIIHSTVKPPPKMEPAP